jgi:hypothetical protein
MEGRREELHDDARRALELLLDGGEVSLAAVRAAGVKMPAQALYALQLAGWPVRRRGSAWRLADPDEPRPEPPAPAPRVRRVPRDDG